MLLGVPKEVKNRETRVALTPYGVRRLVHAGHDVVIQAGAGSGSAIPDAEFEAAGARMCGVDEAWDAELVVKVKEPVPEEYWRLGSQTLFTFLHLAANRPLAQALTAAGTTAVSYDTVQLPDGSLPLLAPMSAVAGRLAAIAGGYHLLSSQGGGGVLVGGAPGVPGANVVVIGAGIAGSHAAHQLAAVGAQVTVLDLSQDRLTAIDAARSPGIHTALSTPEALDSAIVKAHLVIGAVLVPGHRAPKLISHEQVLRMKTGSVLVDIAIDQGGCFEDSRPTTHDDPVYRVEGSMFYCVANMPGAVGVTSTAALTHATLAYVEALAGGVEAALAADPALAAGLNVSGGVVRHPVVAEAFPDLA